MIIKNGHIFTDQGRFMQADIKKSEAQAVLGRQTK